MNELQSMQNFMDALDHLSQAIAATITPALVELVNKLDAFMVSIRRRYLFLRLPRWLPLRWREWTAAHWPERWLPWPDYEQLTKAFEEAR